MFEMGAPANRRLLVHCCLPCAGRLAGLAMVHMASRVPGSIQWKLKNIEEKRSDFRPQYDRVRGTGDIGFSPISFAGADARIV